MPNSRSQTIHERLSQAGVLPVDLERGGRVDLRIYDVLGRRVYVSPPTSLPSGRHALTWDGTDERGRAIRAGMYFWELQANDAVARGKVMLIR